MIPIAHPFHLKSRPNAPSAYADSTRGVETIDGIIATAGNPYCGFRGNLTRPCVRTCARPSGRSMSRSLPPVVRMYPGVRMNLETGDEMRILRDFVRILKGFARILKGFIRNHHVIP